MNIIKSICVAFSMYSKIPMPRVEWNEKNMKYAMCFFPIVGAVIGGLSFIMSLSNNVKPSKVQLPEEKIIVG